MRSPIAFGVYSRTYAPACPRCVRISTRDNQMSALPLTKIPTLANHGAILEGISAPLNAELRRAGLPTVFDENPAAWVSSQRQRLRYFIVNMASREGISDLGQLAGG